MGVEYKAELLLAMSILSKLAQFAYDGRMPVLLMTPLAGAIFSKDDDYYQSMIAINQVDRILRKNPWQIHKIEKGNMDHLTFRRQVLVDLLQENQEEKGRTSTGRPSLKENISIKYDNQG
ncbi:hypothetical protein HHI36_000494 [Cryptolaemus montrouzieri]|uniref:Uncharacterized protein n=1 Tax=Cryptolaemus montrouzieri TaxID=559131 RepID=A0ABD2P5W4_9CUCU